VASPSSNTERGEAYDSVGADELGAEWLARATESQSPRSNASPSEEFETLSTLELLDDEPLSLPTLESKPDSKLESEAALSDPNPATIHRPQRPSPPPRVFDIRDLMQEEDPPRRTGRRS